jgi:hypothetical protein
MNNTWTLVSEELPLRHRNYLVVVRLLNGDLQVSFGHFGNDGWLTPLYGVNLEVVKWMALPDVGVI